MLVWGEVACGEVGVGREREKRRGGGAKMESVPVPVLWRV